ncbi:hypothetical protein FM107_17150 [Sphingobacterium sp. JB170]|nr:hypothetical protein FM107_17150 [Sphingobacterium sp. JB170]
MTLYIIHIFSNYYLNKSGLKIKNTFENFRLITFFINFTKHFII